MLSVGLLLVILGIAVNKVVDQKVVPKISLNDATFQQDVRKVVKDVSHDLTGNIVLMGAIYAGVGVLAVGGYMWTGRKKQPKSEVAQKSEAPAKTPEETKPEPPVVAKPKPTKPKKIEVK